MYVENFNGVKNQFVIYTKKAIIFQSYRTSVAVYIRKMAEIYMRKGEYSRTTSKYIKKFLEDFTDVEIKQVNAEAFDMIMKEI